ncbi:addiction module antidote protein [Desulfovibrio sp. ZJ200]|uniref:addiction module antidote protein n=1 Tax=Desulfovibrio sp. ZJ200 TaxID=2709792 RepID=UPI0013ED5472|nr:addiction module antidote protein [Desulfovibrio sp. ZJ200]
MDMNKFKPFETADYLDSEEMIAEYLTVAAEDPDPDMLLIAIANVAKARGMAKLAQDSGLGRESLYKALRPGSKPRYETIAKILAALNVKMRLLPARAETA